MRSVSIFTYYLTFTSIQTSAFVIPGAPKCNGFFANINDKNRLNHVGALSQSSTVEDSMAIRRVPQGRDRDMLGQYSDPLIKEMNPMTKLSEGYSKLTKEHYLIMAFLQAGCLASGADITTQTLEGANPIDFGHVLAMATVASTMSGVMNAIWLRQLEQAFPGTKTKEVAIKTLIHAIIIASIINSAYLAGVPLFTECLHGSEGMMMPPADMSVIFAGWSWDEFVVLTKLEVCMFIPYNTLAFKFVPPSIRPLTHAAISATFNVAVSAVTLGYFDAWCDRVAAVFS